MSSSLVFAVSILFLVAALPALAYGYRLAGRCRGCQTRWALGRRCQCRACCRAVPHPLIVRPLMVVVALVALALVALPAGAAEAGAVVRVHTPRPSGLILLGAAGVEVFLLVLLALAVRQYRRARRSCVPQPPGGRLVLLALVLLGELLYVLALVLGLSGFSPGKAARAVVVHTPWPAWLVFVALAALLAGLGGLLVLISRRDRQAQRDVDADEQGPQGPPYAALLVLFLLAAGACLSSTAPYTLGSDGPRVLGRHFTPRPGSGGLVFDLDLTVSGLHVPDALELAQIDGQQSAERLHCAAYRVQLSAPPKEDLGTEWPDDKAKDKAKEAGEPPPQPRQNKTTRILAVFTCPANLLSAPQALGGDIADGGTGGGSVGGAP